jgi:hypothetical protein
MNPLPHEQVVYIASKTLNLEVMIGLLVVLVILKTWGQVFYFGSSPYYLNIG